MPVCTGIALMPAETEARRGPVSHFNELGLDPKGTGVPEKI